MGQLVPEQPRRHMAPTSGVETSLSRRRRDPDARRHEILAAGAAQRHSHAGAWERAAAHLEI